jgi:hypothetical protein
MLYVAGQRAMELTPLQQGARLAQQQFVKNGLTETQVR